MGGTNCPLLGKSHPTFFIKEQCSIRFLILNKMLKIKRYHGKNSNVDTNISFEECMNTVFKGMDLDDKNAKVNKLTGHSEKRTSSHTSLQGLCPVSRSRATRHYLLNTITFSCEKQL